MRVLFLSFFLYASLANAQNKLSKYEELPRSYGIEVDLKRDSITFEYKLVFSDTDSTKKFVYKTQNIDTFLYLMERDVNALPDVKDNILFYLHGMMGGQVINMNFTISGLTDFYINPDDSDVGRLLWIRWPGNQPAYLKDKENAYAVAEEISSKLLYICNAIHKMKVEKGERVEIDFMAHSLGCELFKEIHSYVEPDRPLYDDVILTASDLDVDVFLEEGSLANLNLYCQRATMYYSTKDLTLTLSKRMNNKGRLGLDGAHPESIILPNYHFVNVTQISDETFLPMKLTGHAYYRGSRRVSKDMMATLRGVEANLIPGRQILDERPNHYLLIPDEAPE